MPLRSEFSKLRITQGKKHYRYYKYPEIPLSIDDIYVTTTVGDRLDTLANLFYKDVDLWWVIAIANPDIIRRDSFAIKPGVEIRIPQDINNIMQEYQNING
jgi:hypothetical protein